MESFVKKYVDYVTKYFMGKDYVVGCVNTAR